MALPRIRPRERQTGISIQVSKLAARCGLTVINPLAMILVYTVIFAEIMRAKLPGVENTFGYSIYLCAGVLTWGLFAEITGRAQNMFLENANLLKKLSFPKLCLPVVVVANGLLNFSIIFGLFTAFLLISDNFPGLPFVALVPLVALLMAFAIGLGITLGVLNVFFRDVGQFFGIFLTFWFWLTPIVYPLSILPEGLVGWMGLNPMAPRRSVPTHISPSPVADLAGFVVGQPAGHRFLRAGHGTISSPCW